MTDWRKIVAYNRKEERRAENRRNQRMLLDYALYMMVSSYFKKATCTTPMQEGKLYYQYKELGPDKEIEAEEWCDLFIQLNLLDRIPQSFWDSNVEIALIGKSGSDETLIRITDGFYYLYLKIRPDCDMDLDGDPVEIHFVPVEAEDKKNGKNTEE